MKKSEFDLKNLIDYLEALKAHSDDDLCVMQDIFNTPESYEAGHAGGIAYITQHLIEYLKDEG